MMQSGGNFMEIFVNVTILNISTSLENLFPQSSQFAWHVTQALCAAFRDDDIVFYPHSVAPGQVDAWLDREGHARLQ